MEVLGWAIQNADRFSGWVIALLLIGALVVEKLVPRGRLTAQEKLTDLLWDENRELRGMIEKLTEPLAATAEAQRETNRVLERIADTMPPRPVRRG